MYQKLTISRYWNKTNSTKYRSELVLFSSNYGSLKISCNFVFKVWISSKHLCVHFNLMLTVLKSCKELKGTLILIMLPLCSTFPHATVTATVTVKVSYFVLRSSYVLFVWLTKSCLADWLDPCLYIFWLLTDWLTDRLDQLIDTHKFLPTSICHATTKP